MKQKKGEAQKPSKKKTVEGWITLVPGTAEPMAAQNTCIAPGRQYVVFCDPDGQERAIEAASKYPEKHRVGVRVKITYEVPPDFPDSCV